MNLRTLTALGLGCLVLAACSATNTDGAASAPGTAPLVASSSGPRVTERTVTISLLGTNDLHGRVLALPLLAGYVANVRAARAADGGGVVLVDAGDMFQGTLESNLPEGAPVVDAYNAMGYAAAAIGNHEFDFGPAGPAVTPASPTDDPRGALKAAAARAKFPFLNANTLESSSGRHVDWPNMRAATIVEVAGVKVGIVGITTTETPSTTIRANVVDLAFPSPRDIVVAEASRLRSAGAVLVIVAAHAGGKCQAFTGDATADKCEANSEVFELARALPVGTVDAIVGGHSHAGVAHVVAKTPIIEQYSYGRAFGRIDFTLSGSPLRPTSHVVRAPQDLCPGQDKPDFTKCSPVEYEARPVVRSEPVARAIGPAIDGAKAKRAELVGLTVSASIERSYDAESPLGNLFADLMREATPGADVGFMNGGGLRAELPAGPLAYGALFEAFPFDNRMATTKVTGKGLRDLLTAHLERGAGILSVSGIRIEAACKGPKLEVNVRRSDGRRVKDDETLTLAGSDFLFTGGDEFWGGSKPPEVAIADELMRDAIERTLKKRPQVGPEASYDAKKPRLVLPGKRPIRCGG